MKEQILEISEKLKNGEITPEKAQHLLLCLFGVSKRFSEMEEAGKEATSLIAHLKDRYGFNEVEEEAQDKIMTVFEYEGRW